jgi:hypothetical protein
MNIRRLTNFQVRKRLYAYEDKPLLAALPTPSGKVEVRLTKLAAIAVLSSLGHREPCPCRFVVRSGQGYLLPIGETKTNFATLYIGGLL